jgi:CTP synthase
MYLTNLPTVNIAIVGKYTEVQDSYLSVIEAIKHASFNNKYKAKITIVSSEDIEMMGAKDILKNFDGVVVPSGFGTGGIEGKISTAEYCRENKVPYLGMGLGMQTAVIEFAKNVVGFKDANSVEFDNNSSHPVFINGKIKDKSDGSPMRLGQYSCTLNDSSLVRRLYGMPEIKERHRHMYEFNNEFRSKFEEMGLVFAGINNDNDLVEVIEYNDHPFFVGVQYHPEFRSRPNKPHPLFVGLIRQAIANKSN